jgi:hypothetical protein
LAQFSFSVARNPHQGKIIPEPCHIIVIEAFRKMETPFSSTIFSG